MPRPLEKMIVVCQNERPPERESCTPGGGAAFLDALQRELKQRRLKHRFRAVGSTCLGACEGGPHCVVWPDNVWYAGFSAADACEIVEQHLLGGRPVERLRAAWPPARGEAS